jgi:hypothetical protein
MRRLEAEMYLGTSGMTKGVAQAKSIMAGLQSHFRMTGKSLAGMMGGDLTNKNTGDSLRTAYSKINVEKATIGRMVSSGLFSSKEITDQAKSIGKLQKSYDELRGSAVKYLTAKKELNREEAKMAAHWAANPPPMIKTGMAGLWQKMQAGGGIDPLLATAAGYMGGGRMGGLGGAVGGMAGMAGWGAAIGVAIGAIMSALRRMFDFLKSGFMDLIQLANNLQAMKAMTGLGYRTGAVISRASEMGGLDPEAVSIWFSRFQSNMGILERTSPKVSAALAKMGLSIGEIRQLKPDEQFNLIVTSLAKVKGDIDQNAISMALFNRQGAQMRKELLNTALAIEQVGNLGKNLEDVAWKDAAGRAVTYADALAYLDKTLSGLKWKKMDFVRGFLGITPESGGGPLKTTTGIAGVINRADAGKIGEYAMKFVKANVAVLTQGIALIPGIGKLANWAAMKAGILQPPSNIPIAGMAGTSGGLGPLSSFFAPFGKGPGDQWSKVGAFSAPGVRQGFATGIQGWRDKVVDRLTEIARNTQKTHQSVVAHAGSLVPHGGGVGGHAGAHWEVM